MDRSERLEPVTRVARSREQDAARELGEYRKVLDALEARLAELSLYRDEYVQRMGACGADGIDAMKLAEYRGFIARLSEAINYQEAKVRDARTEFERRRRRWSATRTRVAALDKVVSGYEAEALKEEERREQRDLDERAARGRTESAES
jgi:flagellar FliJ protein